MAARDAFTAEEWARLVAAPMLAGIAVTAADPGGLWGAVKESVAVAGAVRAAKADADPLVAEVASAYETPAGREMARGALKAQATGKPPAAVVEAALAELAAVAGLVAAKAPAAAPGFRDWLKAVATRVAEAGAEGGFLGFGGEKVSRRRDRDPRADRRGARLRAGGAARFRPRAAPDKWLILLELFSGVNRVARKVNALGVLAP